MSYLYPLKLKYACSTALWGGSKLSREWCKESELSPLAETWELSCRDDGMMSVIENGEYAGLTLSEYIKTLGSSVVSEDFGGGRFPLLIKFIDAALDLSVQVHPDDEYAKAKENDSGKTEMWYIVDADEGAELIIGLKDGISHEDFRAAVERNDYASVLRRIKVKKGESYFIPSGMPHAICGGILIAEIQQNSDLTYRIYDYDRVGADGKKRALHVAQALDVVRPFTYAEIKAIRYKKGGADDPACLARSEYFSVDLIELGSVRKLYVGKESFHAILSVEGDATLTHCGRDYKINRGDCFFLPAGMGNYMLSGKGKLLVSTL